MNIAEKTTIKADKSQFEQVLINLFKNSVEAMTKSTDKIITVTYSCESPWQHIAIADNGSGIANGKNIFVPFYTTKKQGSGIGLTLCRQIMFNHNGSIKLHNKMTSKSESMGAEAILSLPVL